jgi:hypothetical protein
VSRVMDLLQVSVALALRSGYDEAQGRVDVHSGFMCT